jgi:integrating conjugative element protein (TIGR03746 family)
MSRFKNEVAHLQAHVKTLRLGAGALFVVALLLGFGWWSAPKSLTIHVPPDLRSGSTRKWWDVPPESVYAFSFYIWQQVQRWPTNGEEDYPRNLRALSSYLTPSCRDFPASRTMSTGAPVASCVSACAASTRFPAAATAMIRPRASRWSPTAIGSSRST